MPDTILTTTSDRLFSIIEVVLDKIISSYTPYPTFYLGYGPLDKVRIFDAISGRLRTSLSDIPSVELILNFLEANNRYSPTVLKSYFDSMLFMILAKHMILKKHNVFQRSQFEDELKGFYDKTKESIEKSFMYEIEWFVLLERDKRLKSGKGFIDFLVKFIEEANDDINTTLNSFKNEEYIDDLVLFLKYNSDNEFSMRHFYDDAKKVQPENWDEFRIEADEIIEDDRNNFNLVHPVYVVYNGLKSVNRINIQSFYNFYSNNESIPGKGDKIATSENYYDLASSYKFLPRYIKLSWSAINGGAGIDTRIIPVSGNISNITEAQVINEFYFSQTFKKKSDDYITICSSSDEDFKKSQVWSKILDNFNKLENLDVVDNKIFSTNHEILRKQTTDIPSLKYVGYLITKYEFSGRWVLKEIILLDDSKSNYYYDFNVLYNKKYAYKIATIIKWIYSTSLTEVESFFSAMPFVPIASAPITALTEVVGLVPPSSRSGEMARDSWSTRTLESIREMGLSVTGDSNTFEGRAEIITGEEVRISEEDRSDSRDTLTTMVNNVSLDNIFELGDRATISRRG